MAGVVEKLRDLEAAPVLGERLAELVEQLQAKDATTTRHSSAVADLAVAIGMEMGLDGDGLLHVQLGALLHDVGKLSVPDRILKKPSSLTQFEWVAMRRHAASGERLLVSILDQPDVLAIVRSHHERWDGDGYPEGLRADAIPVGARIVAVADAFEAMTEWRSYRCARPRHESLAEIILNAGTQFDPACVDALRRVLERNETV
jgi:putative nucleotidyltransferase with HDIG domain